jgi:hypothetical protein
MTQPRELSLIKNFDKLELLSQAGVLSSMVRQSDDKQRPVASFGLTPLIEDLKRLDVATSKRKSKDDFDLP